MQPSNLGFGLPSVLLACALVGVSGCAGPRTQVDPVQARAVIAAHLPRKLPDAPGWTEDIFAAFQALEIKPTAQNVCAVVAVTEQESLFRVDPPVAGLGAMARREIDTRAERYHIPAALVRGALHLASTNGESYEKRLAKVETEQQLSAIYDDFIGRVPVGKQLFGGLNPVHTAGPMQVSIDFATEHVREHGYPYARSPDVRAEVYTRRGGMYFGIAHLLHYPVSYDRMIFRFADFNAGHYASRNAAFQNAVNVLTHSRLALDGDLVLYDSDSPSNTELAVRKLNPRLDLSEEQIRRDLEKGKETSFERTRLYERVFELADAAERKPLPRAYIPRIRLGSAKIQRKLTTEWFANRVDERYRRCLK